MDQHEALRIIDATLKSKGFRYSGPGPVDYEGSIPVHGSPVGVSLSIPDVYFTMRPRIFLKDRSQVPIEVLAHVEEGSGICFATGAGLPVDLYAPGQAILRILAEAAKTLELSYRGRGEAELIDEYQHYWFPELPVRCLISKDVMNRETAATVFFAKRDGNLQFMGLAPKAALRGYDCQLLCSSLIWRVDTLLGPAGGIGAPSTLAEFERWFRGQAALRGRSWAAALDLLARGDMLFVAGPNAFVGLRLKMPADIKAGVARGTIRPQSLPSLLTKRKSQVKADRFAGCWCSIDSVTARNNMDSKNLADTSIALVGCGTIGSHLARMLVQCGAGSHARFTLVDTQPLAEGNIGRHLLGFSDIGKPKSEALKVELERFHPQVDIVSSTQDALGDWSTLAEHEIVIDATGDWNVQSALNQQFLSANGAMPKAMLHSYIFMNGAGVQSFLNLRDDFACFRCLKPAFNGPWRYPAGNQDEPLNLQPASCGDGSFIPFTVDASTMAASLSNRAVLDWVNGAPGARLRTAVIDQKRGRYQKPVSPAPSMRCPACSGMRKKLG